MQGYRSLLCRRNFTEAQFALFRNWVMIVKIKNKDEKKCFFFIL